MHRFLPIILAAGLASAPGAEPPDRMSLSGLEQRLEAIDARLARLANYGLGTGIGAIGYRSASHEKALIPEWIEIDLGETVQLDEVVLVPAIRRDTENGFQADAFPVLFRLVAGVQGQEGRVVAEYRPDDHVLPRIAPLIIPCNGVSASWIRVEADQLSLRAFDEKYVLQLSEILAFCGEENVALHRPVTVSSDGSIDVPGWNEQYVVDGFMPYLMDATEGRKSVAYLTPPKTDTTPSLTIDLGSTHPVSRLHLHAVDQSDTLPQAFIGDFGLPQRMSIDGANHPDFSDAVPLIDLRHDTIYDMGPIIMHRFRETPCRYVRFNVIEPASPMLYGMVAPRLGFAEIELFATGTNVARGRPVTTSFTKTDPNRPLSNLTDGLNIYGTILPLRGWLNQLAARHELETERPLIVNELNRRYALQRTNLRRLAWLAVLLGAGTVITVLVDRIIRQREIHRTRERIAADLHDELGANLHAIGLLGDLVTAAAESPDKQNRLLQRMRALTERTGAATRYCTNMLEAKELFGDLVDDMRKSSARIMADLNHTITFEGEEQLQRLNARKRIDLFLFYKECLINVIRHSGASRVSTHLKADRKRICLTITDNGHGLNGDVPPSLKRRARLLGAQVSAERIDSNGSRISLTLKTRTFGIST